MSQNPINALKVTSYNTKHTNNTKIHFKQIHIFETFRKQYNKIHINKKRKERNMISVLC